MTMWEALWSAVLKGFWEGYLQAVTAILDALSAVGILGAAVVAGYAACQSRRSAIAAEAAVRETRNTARGQLAADIIDRYAEPDILEAMRSIRRFRESHGEDWAREFASREVNECNDDLAKKRRLISHHMSKIWKLRNGNFIEDDVAKAAVKRFSATFYIEFIEPLEAALADVEMENDPEREDYNPYPFVYFGELYGIGAADEARRRLAIDRRSDIAQ